MKPLVFTVLSFFCFPIFSPAAVDYSLDVTCFYSKSRGVRQYEAVYPMHDTSDGSYDLCYELSAYFDDSFIVTIGHMDYSLRTGQGFALNTNVFTNVGPGFDAAFYFFSEEEIDEYFVSIGKSWELFDGITVQPSVGCSVFDSYAYIWIKSFNSTDLAPFLGLKVAYEGKLPFTLFMNARYTMPPDREFLMIGAGLGYKF